MDGGGVAVHYFQAPCGVFFHLSSILQSGNSNTSALNQGWNGPFTRCSMQSSFKPVTMRSRIMYRHTAICLVSTYIKVLFITNDHSLSHSIAKTTLPLIPYPSSLFHRIPNSLFSTKYFSHLAGLGLLKSLCFVRCWPHSS